MLLHDTTHLPAAVGPDVRYTDGVFVAYANGALVGSCANSQDAWALARQASFAPPVDPAPRAPSTTCGVLAERYTDDPGTPHATTFASYTSSTRVNLTYALDDLDGADLGTPDHSLAPLSRGDARELLAVLTHPAVQAWMQAPAPAPAVRVEPFVCDDAIGPHYGATIGTYYTLGAVSAFVSNGVADHEAPTMAINRPVTLPIADALTLAHEILTLAASPQLQAALAQDAARRAVPCTPPTHTVVQIEPHICDDIDDACYGQVDWHIYHVGAGETRVGLYVPLVPDDNPHNHADIQFAGFDSLDVAAAADLARNLTTLLTAPCVQAAWARWEVQVAQHAAVQADRG